MADRDKIRHKLVEKFRAITEERLENVNNAFVHLEREPDSEEAASDLMRQIHTLKGEAKMMSLPDVSRVAHSTEDLLAHARDCSWRPGREVADLILRGFDHIADMVRNLGEPVVDVDAFVDAVTETLARGADTRPPRKAPKTPGPGPRTRATTDEPATAGRDFAKRASQAQRSPTNAAEPHQPPSMAYRLQQRDSIRVDMKRLDSLTDLAGDLILGQSRMEMTLRSLMQLVASWRTVVDRMRTHTASATSIESAVASRSEMVEEVKEGLIFQNTVLRDLSSIMSQARDETFDNRMRLNDLEERIRELRLVPISTLFSRFPRAVRDLANEQGKNVQLDVTGADVSVDSDVLDRIGEPVLHLLRNCVDHGIEDPDERRDVGKSETGSVVLDATQKGGVVELSVRDDGRGIDPERIRRTLVARGLADAQEAAALGHKDLLVLLFRSGFSTRARVTDVSGRGVGLDVVKQHLETLGGAVELNSELGRGTTFRLTIPVSMVLSRALVFELGEGLYAVPSDAVSFAADVREDAFETVGAGRAFRANGEAVSVLDLGPLLGLPAAHVGEGETSPILVLEHLGRRRGFLISRFVGERQVMQRRLDPFFEGLRVINSTAVLEGGSCALLVNVTELMEAAGEEALLHVGVTHSHGPARTRTILVVDDSEMTRDLIVRIIRDLGYRVVEAVNGAEAISSIESMPPDLIVTDLEMPVLDGFGILEKVRANPAHASIPVIVFTTRGADVDKKRAADLGADAYLIKTSFREEELVAVVQRFLPNRPGISRGHGQFVPGAGR